MPEPKVPSPLAHTTTFGQNQGAFTRNNVILMWISCYSVRGDDGT